jgi:hypothetical protein
VPDRLRGYRLWFYAAACYNLLWGGAILAFPHVLLDLAGVRDPRAVPLAQVIGMMVGVYSYGYYLLARAPARYAPLIWVGLAGKTFGPVGFVYSAASGTLPWSFGWVCLFNDVIWWPAFWTFALRYARTSIAADAMDRG